MKLSERHLSAAQLLLDYNPKKGVLSWRPREASWWIASGIAEDAAERMARQFNTRYAHKELRVVTPRACHTPRVRLSLAAGEAPVSLQASDVVWAVASGQLPPSSTISPEGGLRPSDIMIKPSHLINLERNAMVGTQATGGSWMYRICHGKEQYRRGGFPTQEKAALARTAHLKQLGLLAVTKLSAVLKAQAKAKGEL